jgi:hypothetical protein
LTDDKPISDSEPDEENYIDEFLLGLSPENCQVERDLDDALEEKVEASGDGETDSKNKKEQQQSYDEKLAGEKLGSKDINFVIATMKKEAQYDEISIKQLFYGYGSAFTKCPIPHTINSRDSGAGKTYLLDIVAGYFPGKYIIYLAGMSDKALVHRPGILVIPEYNEETGEEETRPIDPIINDLQLQINEIQSKEKKTRKDKEEILAITAKIEDIRKRAEKLIDLDNQIILCLDTPQDSLINALMSLISQDTQRDQKYTFAEKSSSGPLRTRVNRLRGMPVLFTTRVIDDTRALRFDEKNRRFINITPDTSSIKIRAANKLIGLKCGSLPAEYDDLVVSRSDRERCKRIVKTIIAKLKLHSKNFKPKESGIKIPAPITDAISHCIPTSENQVWSMTVMGRLMRYLAVITKVNMDNRPKVLDTETGQFYPIATFDDLKETLELMDRAASSVRPYIAKWYNEVFLPTYREKDGKLDEAIVNGNLLIREMHVGVTTEQLAEKTKEIFGGLKPSSKELLEKYLYPLLNQGIIDKIQSQINGRYNIFFPAEEETQGGNIFSLFEDADVPKLKVSEHNLYPSTEHIEESFRSMLGRYSNGRGENRYQLIDTNEKAISPHELAHKYYSFPESCFIPEFSEQNITLCCCNNVPTGLDNKDIVECSTDQGQVRQEPPNVKGDAQSSSFACYYCDHFETKNQHDYEQHVVKHHPKKPGYPNLENLKKSGLKPKGKPWEIWHLKNIIWLIICNQQIDPRRSSRTGQTYLRQIKLNQAILHISIIQGSKMRCITIE